MKRPTMQTPPAEVITPTTTQETLDALLAGKAVKVTGASKRHWPEIQRGLIACPVARVVVEESKERQIKVWVAHPGELARWTRRQELAAPARLTVGQLEAVLAALDEHDREHGQSNTLHAARIALREALEVADRSAPAQPADPAPLAVA